jgi:hypothetical protein
MNDINAMPEFADKPEWFKKLIAGAVDSISMIVNACANNAFLRTCFTKQALVDICERMGYKIPPQTTSTGTVLFFFDPNGSFPVHINRGDLACVYNSMRFEAKNSLDFSPTSTAAQIISNTLDLADRTTGEKIRFANHAPDKDFYLIKINGSSCKAASSVRNAFLGKAEALPNSFDTVTFYSAPARLVQGAYKSSSLGFVDGADFPELYLPDKDVLQDTLSVMAGNDDYTAVDSLIFSDPTAEHFQIVRKSDGYTSLLFGNGAYGKTPDKKVAASYFFGGGDKSNVKNAGVMTSYAGSDRNILGCVNATPFAGGSDEKNLETARILAAGSLKTHDRFVTAEDGEILSMSFGGVSLAKCVPNPYGPLTAKVVCVANGGGNPQPQLQSALKSFLTERTVLDSIRVFVENCALAPQNVNLSVHCKPSYNADFIRDCVVWASKIYFSETSYELTLAYNSNGIQKARERAAAIFGEDPPDAMNGVFEKLFDYMNEFGARRFGETIMSSQFTTCLMTSISGIDFVTINAPVFPIVLDADAVATTGAVAVGIVP